MVKFNEEKQEKRVAELRRKEEEDLALMLSQKYGLDYLDLSRTSINTDALKIVPEETARAAEAAAFEVVGKKLSLAVRAPGNRKLPSLLEDLEHRGFAVTRYMVSEEGLKRAWERYKDLSFAVETKAGVLDISGEEIQALLKTLNNMEDAKRAITETLTLKKSYRISRILETMLAGALASDASDIHLEPEETYVRLRYRLDGVLADMLTLDRDTYELMISRIKLLSGLKLNVRDEAQDGRFSVRIGETDIEIRTSALPGAYGEAIVLRLLNPATIALPMEALGIEKELYGILEREIAKPNGMILTTGPTGSGKTTTLYAFLKKIHTPKVKIITIEDPIEYHLPGIVQTQAEGETYTFAKGLRSALRQDPDVIMVGEIRDEEVAETAINAALTGHLVFSTLHTNNAAGAFPRLIDLSVNPKVISSAVNIVMAQRLVRKLCEACRKETALKGNDKKLVEDIIKGIVRKETVPKKRENAFEAAGCGACNNTGYKGRLGIFEAIVMDESIERAVTESSSEREIFAIARAQGILSMQEDGVLKVLKGVTSLDELRRVVDVGVIPPRG